VFTARYGLNPYIKQIAFRLSKVNKIAVTYSKEVCNSSQKSLNINNNSTRIDCPLEGIFAYQLRNRISIHAYKYYRQISQKITCEWEPLHWHELLHILQRIGHPTRMRCLCSLQKYMPDINFPAHWSRFRSSFIGIFKRIPFILLQLWEENSLESLC
jgi:hypothetical protein